MCAQQSSKTLGLGSAGFGEIFHPGGNMTNAPGLRFPELFQPADPVEFLQPYTVRIFICSKSTNDY